VAKSEEGKKFSLRPLRSSFPPLRETGSFVKKKPRLKEPGFYYGVAPTLNFNLKPV
jgi:hypothetical protein